MHIVAVQCSLGYTGRDWGKLWSSDIGKLVIALIMYYDITEQEKEPMTWECVEGLARGGPI